MADDSFHAITDDLLANTGASRVTIRIEDTDGSFPVVAESRSLGTPSLFGGSVGDLRAAPTFRYLEQERRVLVQDDLENADPAPPADLIRTYGARAQMLAPIFAGERLVGIVSVHQSEGPRAWAPVDVEALEGAAEKVTRAIAADGAR